MVGVVVSRPLTRPRRTVRRAADANLALFDSIIVVNTADAMGVSEEEFRNFLLSIDPDYAAAVAATYSTGYFRDTILVEPQAAIAVLGSSLTAWSHSAVVLTKYYSLEPEMDDELTITGFKRERTLSDMLDLADQRSEELITLVEDEEPVSALYYHETARSYREGTQSDKVIALSYNWRAAVLAEALAYFNGAYARAMSSPGVAGER